MKSVFFFFLILSSSTTFSFNRTDSTESSKEVGILYLSPNEKLIFSFKTNNDKFVSICVDTLEKYVVFRFGTANKLELQFPDKLDTSSWELFTYDYYLRGGGYENAGLDLNSISFENTDNKYIVTDNDAAEIDGTKGQVELKIINKKTNIETIYIEIPNNTNGSLLPFRFDFEHLMKSLED